MLENRFTAVVGARDQQSLLCEAVNFARALGFDTVSATLVLDLPCDEATFLCVDNTPPQYRDVFEDLGQARHDPVMQHCKHRTTPIVWNQETYTRVGKGGMWERQAQFGYCSGIAYALHLPRGRHFFLGLDRPGALPADPTETSRLAGEVQLFAAHALDPVIDVLLPRTAQEPPTLTPRERECLVWTAEGKTAWELGRILGINEQTAVRHLFNASRKLECVNKHQAVVKAIRLGIIR